MIRRLALLFSLCTTVTLNAQPAPAPNPALWQVKGVHGSVYLFGTVHVLKKDMQWETPQIKEALKASDTLYLEITEVDTASVAKVQPLVMQLGLDPEHPLSTKLTPADVTALDEAIKKLGLPGEAAIEPMRPWLVYLTLSVLPAMKAGYSATSGVDPTLMAEAKGVGKPVKGLETAEQQIRFFSSFPEAQQVQLLHEEIADLSKSSDQLNTIVADWASGDVEKIAALENDEIRVKHPDLYQKLLVGRNENFATQIAAILANPAANTTFVAIGAAHLAGPDSVIRMLETKGYKVARVE